ncbi:HDOD domain-containing protein [Planctobacterium marinum]|uniref:HDOD domain-containing protein n=1 Tax=Planctobacterium marinum TaxID=1631968 RepID=UPI001E5A1FC5|nr:HDOD domain-containing protein [Planctobacterium marinum]MCC2604771.1 HDOD domain-containing protein [Planctobacterium marinum]
MGISITAQEKAILQKVAIPPRPETLIKIGEESKKAEPDVSKIAAMITADVGISAAVLQVVNSPVFRRSREIQSIQQAVMTLGLKRLMPLVKSVALKTAVGETEQLAAFWDTASKIANAASIAADLLDKTALKDHAYMLGLFHNAGIPVMMMEFADYSEVLAMSESQGWLAVADEERNRYGTSHPTMSAVLAQKWKLPAVMVETIYYQQDVEGLYSSGELSATGLDLMSILKLARHGVHVEKTDSTSDSEWEEVEDAIIERFDLTDADIETLREQLLDKMSEQ